MLELCREFMLDGIPISCHRYGSGHINETYLLVTNRSHLYILQKINRRIFRDIHGLMANICAVTQHLRAVNPDPRRVLTLVPTVEGEPYLHAQQGDFFRLYEFIPNGVCLDQAENAHDFRQSAVAFGQFQNQLADFPAETLHETIPHFHDTPARFQQLKAAVAEDRAGRVPSVRREIDFFMAREKDAAALMDLHRAGDLPLRVTHNDTKLNNVMLDATTREPLCVIDLDTVMPGLAANDFGDSIRFGASTGAEDERELDRVELSLALFRAYTEGFLSACGNRLTQIEKETLPLGAKLMTMECGVRFLMDYLNGDGYFHVCREGQNLDRARTQIKLVADMEKKMDDMMKIVRE